MNLDQFNTHDYDALVIADSVSPIGKRITSVLVTFPRFILPEVATHRRQAQLSMNAASSRAIPVERRIEDVLQFPVIPIHFGKRQKGMSAAEECDDTTAARETWLAARNAAAFHARAALEQGGHKQWVNRILEPYLWCTVLLTGTEWANFFNLRIDTAAQPEFAHIALKIAEVYFASCPTPVDQDGWHVPFIRPEEQEEFITENLLMISAGRCARLSYTTFDGRRDARSNEDVRLAESLLNNGHMSPFEHQARPSDKLYVYGNFIGWMQYRKLIVGEESTTLRSLDWYRNRLGAKND